MFSSKAAVRSLILNKRALLEPQNPDSTPYHGLLSLQYAFISWQRCLKMLFWVHEIIPRAAGGGVWWMAVEDNGGFGSVAVVVG
jgi:hypothetical protein